MSSKRFAFKAVATAAIAAASLCVVGQAHAAVTIIINNINAAGVGFNDTTPAAPVGGNTGTTIGQQRLNAFTYAANIWGAALTSSAPVVINAQFTPLSCTATGGVLGSAGATQVFRDFANALPSPAPKPSTWYSFALANKIAGSDLGSPAGSPQINSNFNSNLGTPGCLETSGWYYGFDGNEGTKIDFVAVLQHEMAHGLGFQTFTQGSTGAFFSGFPAIWDHFLFSVAAGKNWVTATSAERVASAISVSGLVWNGPIVNAAAPLVLATLPVVVISGTAAGAAAGTYASGEAIFGPLPTLAGVTGTVMPVSEQTAGAGPGCETFSAANALAVNNRIALIARGTCGFVVKVKNAQNAGALGVIISDNVSAPISGLGGSDPTITIPAVRVTLETGNAIRAQLSSRSRSRSGVVASITRDPTQTAGLGSGGRVLMFAPNPFQGGSSVSHYDTSASPNLLMEPSINGDLTQLVGPPRDLTLPLFTEIGW